MSAHHSVSDILRETRTVAQSLKEDLKCKEAFDRDAEFKRKSLRKLYLKLLLLHPNCKESKDSETHMWMQTSYQFISVYKQRLAALDSKLFSQNGQGSKQKNTKNSSGHVEYRRLLSRFRQFLAEEEKFFARLLIRFRTQFALDEALAALIKSNILTEDSVDSVRDDPGRDGFPDPSEVPVRSNEGREAQIAIFAKLLVCLGDIARYREQYNDGGGRPRAGHEEGAPRKSGRGGRKGNAQESRAKPRNYNRARSIYEQARLLVPSDGNAFHQLAILSSYQRDSFGSLFHYYRALCLRQPYDTASDNLITILKKAMDQYISGKRENTSDETNSISLRIKRFKEWVVVLHGLWYLDADDSVTRAVKHANTIISEFKSLVSDRILPNNVITETIVLAFSSLWVIRMVRDMPIRANKSSIENHVAIHTLNLMRAILEVGRSQLSENMQEDMGHDQGNNSVGLAQFITAAFRRTLPAIRVCSKWLRTNINYVDITRHNSAPNLERLSKAVNAFWETYSSFITALNTTFPISKLPVLTGPLEEDVDLFGFSPISSVKRPMFMTPSRTATGLEPGQEAVHPNEEYLMRISDVLRDAQAISELEKTPFRFPGDQLDTKDIDIVEESLVVKENGKTELSELPVVPDTPTEDDIEIDNDFDNATQTSRTEDDVIRDAFDAALRDDLGEEDEKIVWPKIQRSPFQASSSLSPPNVIYESPSEVKQSVQPLQPGSELDSVLHPFTHDQASVTTVPDDKLLGWKTTGLEVKNSTNSVMNSNGSTTVPRTSSTVGTTAQDLLNNVLGVGFPRGKTDQLGNKSQPFGSQARHRSISISNRLHPEYPHANYGHIGSSAMKSIHETIGQTGQSAMLGHSISTTPQASLLFGSMGSSSLNTKVHPPAKSIWSGTETNVSNQASPNNSATLQVPRFPLAPGHERGRSLSLSVANTQPWSPLTHNQEELMAQASTSDFMSGSNYDPIYTTSNEKDHAAGYHESRVGSGYSMNPNVTHGMNGDTMHSQIHHHRSLSNMSGYSSFTGLPAYQSMGQVVYDSQQSMGLKNGPSMGESISQGVGPYLHAPYVAHAPLSIQSPSVQRSIWNT